MGAATLDHKFHLPMPCPCQRRWQHVGSTRYSPATGRASYEALFSFETLCKVELANEEEP